MTTMVALLFLCLFPPRAIPPRTILQMRTQINIGVHRIYNQIREMMHFMSKMGVKKHTNFNMYEEKPQQKYCIGVKSKAKKRK